MKLLPYLCIDKLHALSERTFSLDYKNTLIHEYHSKNRNARSSSGGMLRSTSNKPVEAGKQVRLADNG